MQEQTFSNEQRAYSGVTRLILCGEVWLKRVGLILINEDTLKDQREISTYPSTTYLSTTWQDISSPPSHTTL